MGMADYWVYQWMDEHSVSDAKSAHKALLSKQGLSGLLKALPRKEQSTARVGTESTSIVAGRGLDLSGQLDCLAAECRQRQADDLFRHVWHYFDRIVVADSVAHELRGHEHAGPEDLRKWIAAHLEVLLYLRQMGGESLLTFEEKPIPCELHWKRHASEAGLQMVVEDSTRIAERLSHESDIQLVERNADGSNYVFIHPEFEHHVWVDIDNDTKDILTEDQVKLYVATKVLARYTAHLASDVSAGSAHQIPLGSTLALHCALLEHRTPSVAETAFQIELPVLTNVAVADLIRVRNEERDLFERFQTSLRTAIRERLKLEPSENPAQLAREIREDLIDPNLQKIRERLKASEQLLSRKSAVSIGVGVLVTVCGALTGIGGPIAAAAGIGSMLTGGGTALAKHLEERRDIQESDYYFLWKASRHAHST